MTSSTMNADPFSITISRMSDGSSTMTIRNAPTGPVGPTGPTADRASRQPHNVPDRSSKGTVYSRALDVPSDFVEERKETMLPPLYIADRDFDSYPVGVVVDGATVRRKDKKLRHDRDRIETDRQRPYGHRSGSIRSSCDDKSHKTTHSSRHGRHDDKSKHRK
jgi:hypothetical protein